MFRQSKLIMIALAILLVSILVAGCNGGGTTKTQPIIPPPPPAPASFSVSNLSVQPLQLETNETVTISVSVANTGGTQGSYNVILNINGALEETQSVTIAAGSNQSVIFGTYVKQSDYLQSENTHSYT